MNLFLTFIILAVMALAYNFFKTKGNYQSVSAADVAQLIAENPKLVLIDVRTPAEIAGGKIKKALEINIQSPDFNQKIAKLPKDQAYVLYCRSGSRSAMACSAMAKQGFEQLYNLSGGYSAWPSRG
jgi:rhodanese-related sulfurtransferase